MAGIGEASAILGTVQVGLSLARTLYACISDYRSAREEISSLATDVEVTLTQVQELDRLVSDNDTTKLLNERGLKLAETCAKDSKLMVEKLLKLLTKTGVPERRSQAIRLDDIDVSRFGRAGWVFLKPQVIVAKRELDSIRLSMLFARSCIEAQSASNSADRDAAVSRIAGLERSRWLARRLLREAQAESQKALTSAASNVGVTLPAPVSTLSEPPLQRSSTKGVAFSRKHVHLPNVPAVLSPIPAAPASLDGEIVDRMTQQVQRDEEQLQRQQEREQERMRASILQKIKQDEAERLAEDAAAQLARAEAVEAYKADVRERLRASREKSDKMRAQLQASFSHELADADVDRFLDAQNAQDLQDDFVALMIDEYKAPSTATVANAEESSLGSTIVEPQEAGNG